jgi:hypothetical protein
MAARLERVLDLSDDLRTFRAAGYTPQEVDGFNQVLKYRIEELNQL